MYTCCPICKTNFNVTEAQLQVAQGKVRCGSCKNVFNARQHIHYAPSKAVPTSPPAIKQATTDTPKPSQKQQSSVSTGSTNQPISEIDAIFNALDTQLSKGTYVDIAKSDKPDIRETAFDNILDDEIVATDTRAATKAHDIFLRPAENIISNNDEPDLNLYHEAVSEADEGALLKETADISESTPTVSLADNNSDTSQQTQKNSTPNQPASKPTHQQEDANKQQHTFDFVGLPDEANLPSEDEEQLAAVNTPLEMPATNKLVTKTENDDLHKAIDNIIKVNNSITTPFEENDADHFVIEMQSEADVELVDEDDIDKLFASTDSLKISDLKFDKFRTSVTENKLNIEDEISATLDNNSNTAINSDTAININISLDDSDDVGSNLKFEDDEDVIENNFNTPAFEQPIETFNNDDSDIIDLEAEFDNPDIDEEIILSSNDLDDVVPHRLRHAVASLEQPPMSIKKRLFYTVAIIALISLSAYQLVLFKSTAIAKALPALQPLLVSICKKAPCRYTGNYDRQQIKIINRDVRLHPKIKGALLISATIMNQASYTQPYPTILLKFTDLTGATVAQRYFQPTEYLGLLNKPFALMPSKKPVQLNIEVLDPGSDAINFQFYFL